MTEYREKYLKYKKKYLELKAQYAGAYPFGKGGSSIAIMAKVTGEKLDRINSIRTKFKLKPEDNIHITLLQFHIDFNNLEADIFLDPRFIDVIKTSFIKNIKNTGIELISPDRNWDFFGMNPTLDTKFLTRVYILPQDFKENLKKFRMDIYNFLNTTLSISKPKYETRGKGTDQTEFIIYSTINNSKELYAITKNYYHTIDTWKPHISIMKMGELIPDPKNKTIYDKINILQSNQEKIDKINCTIGRIKPIDTINMRNDIGELSISVKISQFITRFNGKPTVFSIPV